MTAPRTHAAGTSTDRRRERHVTISVLAKVLAGETIAPEGTCQAFAIHPNRRRRQHPNPLARR